MMLLAQAYSGGFSWSKLLDPGVLALFIPIVAIIVFGGCGVLAQWHKHVERMELIRHGINPDTATPPEAEE